MRTTTCCFHTSTLSRDGGGMGDLKCGGNGGSNSGGDGGDNLTQSCVQGMTSLGGPL